MKFKKYRITLSVWFVLIYLSGCAVSESFKTGQELSQANRWDDAIIYFEKALNEDPDKQEYKDALLKAKQESAKVHYEKAKRTLAATPEPDMPTLQQVFKEVDLAYKLDQNNKEISSFHNNLKEKISSLQNTVKSLYSQVEIDMQKEDWGAAVTKLRQISKLYPSYEDMGNRLAKAEQEGAKIYYQQGIALGKQEDWKMAAQSFKAAMDLNPAYYDVATLHREAKSKDSVDYFIGEAEKAVSKQNWERSILMYEKAREYETGNMELVKKLDDLKTRSSQNYYEDALKLFKQGMLNKALKKIELIKNYNPAIENDPIFKEFIKNIAAKLIERADKYAENELWGNALVWYQKLNL